MKKSVYSSLIVLLSAFLCSCSANTIPQISYPVSEIQPSSHEEVVDAFASVSEPLISEEPTTVDNKTYITFNFMGDCTLGTQLGADTPGRFNATADIQPPEYFFSGVQEILNEGTFNVTNCEGVLTDNPLTEAFKDYTPAFWFKSSARNAQIFSKNNIHIVGIANNHINDYNAQGRLDTIAALEANGIQWTDSSKSLILEHEGIKVAFFCITLWDGSLPGSLCTQITEAASTTDLQIVFFHGGTENVHQPDYYKVDYAHAFVDAGADLVVGSHPHVLQPLETYNGVNIVYSLGNFVYGGHSTPENRTIVYQHTFTFEDKNLIRSAEEIYPCYIYTGNVNEYQPTLITDALDKEKVLNFMYGGEDSPL